jgi:hypothetical protein
VPELNPGLHIYLKDPVNPVAYVISPLHLELQVVGKLARASLGRGVVDVNVPAVRPLVLIASAGEPAVGERAYGPTRIKLRQLLIRYDLPYLKVVVGNKPVIHCAKVYAGV